MTILNGGILLTSKLLSQLLLFNPHNLSFLDSVTAILINIVVSVIETPLRIRKVLTDFLVAVGYFI